MSSKEQKPGGAPPGERMSGSRAVVVTLERLGVTDVFGLPGGAIMPVFDALYDSQINQIIVRHEQAAGHAAEGYALSSGKTGVAIVTSGPGATNLMTALADAHMDSIPLLAISGQVSANAIGTDAFQEADVVGVSMPITKHNFLVTEPEEIPATLAQAYHLASTGRKGPVLVDIAKNAQVGELDFSWPVKVDLPGYKVASKPHAKQIKAAAKLMAAAERSVLYVGGGSAGGRSDGRAKGTGGSYRFPGSAYPDRARGVPVLGSPLPRNAGNARFGAGGNRLATRGCGGGARDTFR